MFAVVAGLAALAEPCVLEKGYKPPAKQADDEVVSLLGELSPGKPSSRKPNPLRRKLSRRKLQHPSRKLPRLPPASCRR